MATRGVWAGRDWFSRTGPSGKREDVAQAPGAGSVHPGSAAGIPEEQASGLE